MNRTIKEEFNCWAFHSFDLTKAVITKSILAYNQLRPHSFCYYLTFNQAHLKEGTLKKRWQKQERKNLMNEEQFVDQLNRIFTI